MTVCDLYKMLNNCGVKLVCGTTWGFESVVYEGVSDMIPEKYLDFLINKIIPSSCSCCGRPIIIIYV